MKLEHQTKRLTMRVLNEDDAQSVLRFYKNNAPIIEKYEPICAEQFYTAAYHENLLRFEYEETLKLHMLRFWLFEKEHPAEIIGTISFHHITPNQFSSTLVGYKMDAKYWRRGYCYEALSCGIDLLSEEIGIRRFEALVHPDNIPSISLLEKLDFKREGLLKDKVYIQNQWQDHFLYALVKPTVSP